MNLLILMIVTLPSHIFESAQRLVIGPFDTVEACHQAEPTIKEKFTVYNDVQGGIFWATTTKVPVAPVIDCISLHKD